MRSEPCLVIVLKFDVEKLWISHCLKVKWYSRKRVTLYGDAVLKSREKVNKG